MPRFATIAMVFVLTLSHVRSEAQESPAGFLSLFNGKDLSGWKIPEGNNGHWRMLDGVIDYDARSEAPGDKRLWSERSFRDFVLRVEWRLKATPFLSNSVLIMPNGLPKLDEKGKEVRFEIADADSGIYLRGMRKAQVNIWNHPQGSGEIQGWRIDPEQPAAVRAAVTPRINADKNFGEWNLFEIIMRGDRVTVILNGRTVVANAQLPGIAPEGPIGFQHHGSFLNGEWRHGPGAGAPSLVQFRNIFIKEL